MVLLHVSLFNSMCILDRATAVELVHSWRWIPICLSVAVLVAHFQSSYNHCSPSLYTHAHSGANNLSCGHVLFGHVFLFLSTRKPTYVFF